MSPNVSAASFAPARRVPAPPSPCLVVPDGGRVRRVLLPAPALAAGARRSVLVERDVAELARHRVAAVDQLAVERAGRRRCPPTRSPPRGASRRRHGARTRAPPARRRSRRSRPTTGRPTADSSELPEIRPAPSRGWARRRAGRTSSTRPGHAHAHALVHDFAVRARGTPRPSAPAPRRTPPACAGVGQVGLHQEPGVEAGEADSRRPGPQIHGEDAGPLDVQVEEARPASAPDRRLAPSVTQPSVDQLADDGRHRAALQAGSAGELGPRQRLVAADDVERDPAVDVAGRFAGRDLEVGEVDLAHA